MKNINKINLIGLLLLSTMLINLSRGGAQQLSIGSGAFWVNTGSVTISEGFDLNVDGKMDNKYGSRVNFYGNDHQDIKGISNPDFNDIYLNNSGPGIRLYTDIYVSGTIYMTDGNLDMLDQSIDLGSNGKLSGENSNSKLISTNGSGSYGNNSDAGDGQMVITMNISTTGVTNAAGLGISVTPTTNWGSCQVTRSHQRTVGSTGDNSIFRKFTITPTNASNLASSVTIKYNSDELNGYSAGSLKVYQIKKSGAKGVEWEELNSTDNGSEVTATTNDNDETELTLTLANTNKLLPISLLDFAAYCDRGAVLLQWHTASEDNNDYFILEKSLDGWQYQLVAKITGNGTTNTLSSYEFLDLSAENAIVYYRLSQVDFDGTKTSFKPIVSRCGVDTELKFTVVNPVQNTLQISASFPLNQEVNLGLFDINGRMVFQKKLHQNENRWMLAVNKLSAGMYYLRFSSSNLMISKTLTIIQ